MIRLVILIVIANLYNIESASSCSTHTRGKYVGCYSDQALRGLSGYYAYSSMNTIERCIERYRIGNYIYAGLQVGSYCMCGNEMRPSLNKKVAETACSTPCTGNAIQFCGAGWTNSIYQTGLYVANEFGEEVPDVLDTFTDNPYAYT